MPIEDASTITSNTTQIVDPRARQITAALNLSGTGIEYGPLDKPLVPKPRYSVSYVDYADRAQLVDNFRDHPNRDTERICEVDIVTDGQPITAFAPDSSLDYVVASHVMEHVPNLLGWLENNLRILKVGGRIGLALPDKRYCFDLKRHSTTISDVIAAYLQNRVRPSFEQICDQVWNAATVKAADVWNNRVTADEAPYTHPRPKAFEILKGRLDNDAYFDCHCWVFTDDEFLQLMRALERFATIDYQVISFLPTARGKLEFFVTIERVGS